MDKIERKSLEGNINKLCILNLVDGMWFAFPIFVLFFLNHGMSFMQVGLIVSASDILTIVLDIPSSIWADKYSRKSIMILSNVAFMLLNVIIFASNSFEMFFIAFAFNGIGTAFSAGIFSAFTYDTLLSLGKEKEYEKVQAKIVKYRFVGRIIASIVGAYTYSLNPRIPFLLSALANLFCVAVAFGFKEPVREKSISKSFNQIKEGLNFLLKHKIAWNTIVIFSAMNAIWNVLFNYYQPALQASQVPVIYFGIIFTFISVFGFLGASFYPRIKSKIDWKAVMIAYLVINIISSIFFGAQVAAAVILSIALLTFASGSFDIYIGSVIHKVVPSSHRATTISIQNQIFMLLSIVFVNSVSFFVDRNSIFIGMIVNAFIAFVVLLAFLKVNYKKLEILQTE